MSERESRVLYRHRRRVTLRDTDGSGLIHYAVILDWTEALFTEWLQTIGRPIGRMLAEGEGTPVVRAEADFRSAVGVDDMLDMELSAAHVGTASFSVWIRARSAESGDVVIEARVFHVYTELVREEGSLTPKGSAAPLPDWLRTALMGGSDGSDAPLVG